MKDVDLTGGYFKGSVAEAELLLATLDRTKPSGDDLALFWYIMPWKASTILRETAWGLNRHATSAWCATQIAKFMHQWGYNPESDDDTYLFDRACERAWDRSELKQRVMSKKSEVEHG